MLRLFMQGSTLLPIKGNLHVIPGRDASDAHYQSAGRMVARLTVPAATCHAVAFRFSGNCFVSPGRTYMPSQKSIARRLCCRNRCSRCRAPRTLGKQRAECVYTNF